MRLTVKWVAVIGLLATCVLLGSCGGGPDTGHVGPIGPVGPQGEVGASSNEGPSSESAIFIDGTGELVESEYALGGFSEIAVSDFFKVRVRQGETYRVVVEAVEALTPYLDVRVEGRTLQIGLKSEYTYNLQDTSHSVEVTLPTLTRATVTDFAEVRLDGFTTEDALRLEVADFGSLEGSIDVGNLQVEVSNHGELKLTGAASQVAGQVTDHSDADLSGLEAAALSVDTDAYSTLAR